MAVLDRIRQYKTCGHSIWVNGRGETILCPTCCPTWDEPFFGLPYELTATGLTEMVEKEQQMDEFEMRGRALSTIRTDLFVLRQALAAISDHETEGFDLRTAIANMEEAEDRITRHVAKRTT